MPPGREKRQVMSDQPALDGRMVKVSAPVKARLTELRDARAVQLDRRVTFSEVIEQLLADAAGRPL
jgi:hypothetical protein